MPNTDELKGRAKEAAGVLSGDQELKNEGRLDQATGKVKEAIDTAKEKISGAAEKAKKGSGETD